MTGDLLLRYEEIARQRGDEHAFKPLVAGVLDLFRRHDPEAAMEQEIAKATNTVSKDDYTAIIEDIAKAKPLLGSPIEMLLLPWLLAQRYRYFPGQPRVRLPGESGAMGERNLAIVPQLPIGRYRADFAIACKHKGVVRFVIVEADGAAFHNSVDQGKRDLNRDVFILNQKRVLDIVRIDGKSIVKSPKNAAELVEQCVFDAHRGDNPATAEKFKV